MALPGLRVAGSAFDNLGEADCLALAMPLAAALGQGARELGHRELRADPATAGRAGGVLSPIGGHPSSPAPGRG